MSPVTYLMACYCVQQQARNCIGISRLVYRILFTILEVFLQSPAFPLKANRIFSKRLLHFRTVRSKTILTTTLRRMR